MKIIEFFEKDPAENLVSGIACKPDQVILLGSDLKLMEKQAARYRDILLKRGIDVAFSCISTVSRSENGRDRRGTLESTLDALTRAVGDGEDCVVDLTGGEDLCLVAMGMLFQQRGRTGIQMHRFNLLNNTIEDCDLDGNVISNEPAPALTVEENILLYGGSVVYAGAEGIPGTDGTPRWDMNGDFRNAVLTMWDICRVNPHDWNLHTATLAEADKLCGDPEGLTLSVATAEVAKNLRGGYGLNDRITKGLTDAGLITGFSEEGGRLTLTFRDGQVKRCLTKEGILLEMKVFLEAMETLDPEGEPVYNDLMNGVFIDWDGVTGGFDTRNEIDVMLMHGMVPVFISCKNGRFDAEELYKLNTVATRFGGANAKRVLIATSMDKCPDGAYLRQRAADMRIKLVDGCRREDGQTVPITRMTREDFRSVFLHLWSNE